MLLWKRMSVCSFCILSGGDDESGESLKIDRQN